MDVLDVNLTTPLFALLVFFILLLLYLVVGYLKALERKIDRLELKIVEILAEISYLRRR